MHSLTDDQKVKTQSRAFLINITAISTIVEVVYVQIYLEIYFLLFCKIWDCFQSYFRENALLGHWKLFESRVINNTITVFTKNLRFFRQIKAFTKEVMYVCSVCCTCIYEQNPISRKNKGSKSDFPKTIFNVIVVVCITTSKTQMSQSFFKTSSSFMRCKCHFALESEPLSETETTSAMSVYQIFRNISPMIYHNLSRLHVGLQTLVAKCFCLAEF